MLLPILLISILTNAGLIDDLINNTPKLYTDTKVLNLSPEVPEDAKLNTMQLISKYGYNGELRKVTTEDGYILELHRITGPANSTDSNKQKPVAFVMHGLMADSSCFVTFGNQSLAFLLADAGYDVWLGNARGNIYSGEHKNKTISKKDYWNFSWHEIGTLDLPAMIDYIVKTTGLEKIFYIGHSQGTTSFFIMATERSKYQEHIVEMYAMSPVVYWGRIKSPPLQLLSQIIYDIEIILQKFEFYEFNIEEFKKENPHVCANKITQTICSVVMSLIGGFDPEQLDLAWLPVIFAHFPGRASMKQILHYGQLIKSGHMISSGNFQQYDYGIIGNQKKYNSPVPPKYDLNKITAPIHLYYSKNDWLANTKDVDKFSSELSNLSSKTLIEYQQFNHFDFLWSKDVKKNVYDQMLSLMNKKLI
ncbi:lipase 3 isoform X2 [Solenopsis invicta]|uniref:lipase 3 isoform X2 n=1 Tax=Solenopsis invicta TaxID=13686 RepID=UPI00059600A8|nr:lipase 3 isoform X2 [Solenopsis invicta]